MSPERITKEIISPAERLPLTLRFLATGESQQSLSFSYRIGKAIYLATPSMDDWVAIAEEFEETWNLPNVIGALDGKHICITCPSETGTQYHNYKGFFSLQFFALCDARYCFTMFDIGQYRSNNDTGSRHV